MPPDEPQAHSPSTPQGRQTRDALLDAGITIAERSGLAGLSVNAVVAEVGLAKGTFYVHFTDREEFVNALHKRFYTGVSVAIEVATKGLPAGSERLLAGIEAYLDACLESRGVKALLFETRGDTSMTTMIAERQALFVSLATPNLEAMGWPDPSVAARIFVAMASEVAMVELEAGHPAPAARATLRDLVAGGDFAGDR